MQSGEFFLLPILLVVSETVKLNKPGGTVINTVTFGVWQLYILKVRYRLPCMPVYTQMMHY